MQPSKMMGAVLHATLPEHGIMIFKLQSGIPKVPIQALDNVSAPKSSLEYAMVVPIGNNASRRVPYDAKDWLFELDGALVIGMPDGQVVGMYARSRIVFFDALVAAVLKPSIKPVPPRPEVKIWGRYLLIDKEPVGCVTTCTRVFAKMHELYENDGEDAPVKREMEARWDIGVLVQRGLNLALWNRMERENGVLVLM